MKRPSEALSTETSVKSQVFQRFKEANLKLKAAECNLFQKEVALLGHVVSEEGIKYDPGKVESVRN